MDQEASLLDWGGLTTANGRPARADRIFLRPLTENDIDDRYIAWFADPDVTQFIQSRNFSIEESQRYLRDGRLNRSYFLYAICLKETGTHIGNVKIGPINWPHLVSDLVTVIGQKDCWGKGLAAEAIALGSRMAVEEYGLRKLHGAILESNFGSIKAYTRAGWVVEGRLEGHYLVDGAPMDAILVSYFGPQGRGRALT
jgi:RimJ/RimL family protein N-acetyltransferase